MVVKDISFATPEENILFDEVLLDLAEKGLAGETLRFWESAKVFVVLGRISKLEEDVRLDLTRREKIPVLRRASGGGTVLQGPGCLNFSFVLSKARNPKLQGLRESYQIILSDVVASLKSVGVAAVMQPLSDLALISNQKKFSGNAQKRGRNHILHHGTVLYDFDLPLIEKYLSFPRQTPEYRQGRAHRDFVTNINVSGRDIKSAFQKHFTIERVESTVNEEERQSLEKFLMDRVGKIVF